MHRKFLRSKIHRAIVTGCDLDYEGSISIPVEIIEAAKLLEFEAVWVWNVLNGNRFETYVIRGVPGEIAVNGAAAHLVSRGDTVIISAFGFFDNSEIEDVSPTIVIIDGDNRKFSIKDINAILLKLRRAASRIACQN